MSMGSGGIFGNPNIGMGGFGGGIFGQPRKRFGIDALEMGQPNIPPFMGAERMPAPAAPMAQQPAKGDKTKRIIGIIGDALLGLGGQQGVYGPMMAQKRAEERQMEMMQQQRRQGLEDYRSRKLVDQEFAQPEGPDIGLFEDNAGNRFRYDKRTGMPLEDKPVFVDPNERVYFNGDAMVRVPNTFRQQGGGYGEGTVIENDKGERMILRQGQWQPVGGAASNGSGNFRP